VYVCVYVCVCTCVHVCVCTGVLVLVCICGMRCTAVRQHLKKGARAYNIRCDSNTTSVLLTCARYFSFSSYLKTGAAHASRQGRREVAGPGSRACIGLML